jgi:hypothetical protein
MREDYVERPNYRAPCHPQGAGGAGDVLLFEEDKAGVRVRAVRAKTRFAKYRGIGNGGISSGKKAIIRWTRAMRER